MIVHLLPPGVYTPRFIAFAREYLPSQRARFVVRTQDGIDRLRTHKWIPRNVVRFLSGADWAIRLSVGLVGADHVVFHSLPPGINAIYLSLRPRLARKSTWVVWGADLHDHLSRQRSKRELLSRDLALDWVGNLGQVATGVPGDAQLVRQLFTRAVPIKPVFYPNPIARDALENASERARRRSGAAALRVLVGNSASPFNEHLHALHLLASYAPENIEVIVPLSYDDNGDTSYGDEVVRVGRDIFGHKFQPLREHLAPSDYADVLASIDVAVFAHERQQGLATILGLAYLGRKIYTPSSNPTWGLLSPRMPLQATESLVDQTFEEFQRFSEEESQHMHNAAASFVDPAAIAPLWENLLESTLAQARRSLDNGES